MTATFRHLDTCYSDYFIGHSNHVIAIPVTCITTFKDIIEAIETEYIEFNDYTGFTESDFNEALESLKHRTSKIRDNVPDVCKDIETDLDGNTESVFLYLTVMIDD